MGEHTDDIEVRATRYLSQAVQQRKGRIERLTRENQRLRRKLWAQTWALVTVGAFATVYVIVEYGPLVWH
jgi:hypothetical protein